MIRLRFDGARIEMYDDGAVQEEVISRTGDPDYDGPDGPCGWCKATAGFSEVTVECECGGHTQHRCLACGKVEEMFHLLNQPASPPA